jgi:hypothetical protein
MTIGIETVEFNPLEPVQGIVSLVSTVLFTPVPTLLSHVASVVVRGKYEVVLWFNS